MYGEMQESGLTAIILLMSTCSMGGQDPVFSHPESPGGHLQGVCNVMAWHPLFTDLAATVFIHSVHRCLKPPTMRPALCWARRGPRNRDPTCVLQDLAKDSTTFYPSSPACRPASTGWGLMTWAHVCPQGHPAKDVWPVKATLQKGESVDRKWEEKKRGDSVSRPGWRLPSCGPS